VIPVVVTAMGLAGANLIALESRFVTTCSMRRRSQRPSAAVRHAARGQPAFSAAGDRSLTPGDNPRIGRTRFADWLSRFAQDQAVPRPA
jgi:hypothetical protein